jgi:hypothetical protein
MKQRKWDGLFKSNSNDCPKKRRKEVENNSYNFLKVRDDHEPFKFFKVEDKFINPNLHRGDKRHLID